MRRGGGRATEAHAGGETKQPPWKTGRARPRASALTNSRWEYVAAGAGGPDPTCPASVRPHPEASRLALSRGGGVRSKAPSRPHRGTDHSQPWTSPSLRSPPGHLPGCELGPRRVPPPHPAPAAPSSRTRSPAPSVPVLWPTRLPSAYCGAGAMPGPGRPRRASCRGAGCRGGTNHPTTTSTAGGRSGGHVTEKVAPEPVLKRQQPP